MANCRHDENKVTHLCACVWGRERKRGTGPATVILVCRKWSKFEEASGRKRNSQDDTLPRSKINTETESVEAPEDEACNVHLPAGKMQRQPVQYELSLSLPLILWFPVFKGTNFLFSRCLCRIEAWESSSNASFKFKCRTSWPQKH